MVSVIFGFSFVFTKGTLAYLSPFQLLGLRFGLAALALTSLTAVRLIRINIKMAHLPSLLKIAVLNPVLYFTLETYGVKYTSASESGVVIALAPMAVMVLSILMLGEKITAGQRVCIAAAVAGVALMALSGPGAPGGAPANHLLGILVLFGAVMAAAFYNVFSRQGAASFSPMDITFVMMWLGALVFNAIGLSESYFSGQLGVYYTSLQHPQVVVGLLYLGLFSSVVAFFLLNYALSRMPASRAAVFLNLIPVVSLLAGILFYGERLGIWQMASCGLILLGVWGTSFYAVNPSGETRGA